MLDIRFIAENAQFVKDRLSYRSGSYDVDAVVALYNQRREILKDVEVKRATRNSVSEQIAALKRQKKDASHLIKQMQELGEDIKAQDQMLQEIEPKLKDAALNIPNLPHESVPLGRSDKDNKEIRRVGECRKFDFTPKPHWEIGEGLDILDPATAAKITGTRFTMYKGDGAKLERALMNFMLDTHCKNGYCEIFPPFMVNADSMYGTGQLPKFKDDAFAIKDFNYYLIPTAEVPVTNMYRGDVLEAERLPINYCAYSACFRAEAGTAGRDTKGLIRQHQFQKVELVKFVHPDDSFNQLEKITADAEKILQLLNLPYRVVCLCSGDLGFSSAKTYDIEVWLPSYNKYVEISSCSNFCDYQARRMNIKFKEGKGLSFIHTLNGSGIPLGRTAAAVIENYQNADGSISVPKALVPYLGKEIIK